jgi:hypothetical protein
MNTTPPERPAAVSIVASLARSETQIAAGQAVLLAPALGRLRASIARMQAGEKQAPPRLDA